MGGHIYLKSGPVVVPGELFWSCLFKFHQKSDRHSNLIVSGAKGVLWISWILKKEKLKNWAEILIWFCGYSVLIAKRCKRGMLSSCSKFYLLYFYFLLYTLILWQWICCVYKYVYRYAYVCIPSLKTLPNRDFLHTEHKGIRVQDNIKLDLYRVGWFFISVFIFICQISTLFYILNQIKVTVRSGTCHKKACNII